MIRTSRAENRTHFLESVAISFFFAFMRDIRLFRHFISTMWEYYAIHLRRRKLRSTRHYFFFLFGFSIVSLFEFVWSKRDLRERRELHVWWWLTHRNVRRRWGSSPSNSFVLMKFAFRLLTAIKLNSKWISHYERNISHFVSSAANHRFSCSLMTISTR